MRFLLFLASVSCMAQPFFLGVRYDTMDPAGACTDRSVMVWNYANGKLWACKTGTWTDVTGTGGGGGTVTSVGMSKTDDTNVTATITGSPVTTAGVINVALGWTGLLAVPRGGSGVGTLTGVLFGNGTSPFSAVALPSDATKFLNGNGAFTVPSGTGVGSITSGAYSAIPGTCSAGDLYLSSPYVFKCGASNVWTPYYRGWATTLPPASVTWVQQNSSTYTSTNGYGVIKVIQWNGNYSVAELITTVPMTAWKYYARVSYSVAQTNFFNHGLCMYESGTSKALLVGITAGDRTSLELANWTNSSTFNQIELDSINLAGNPDLVYEVGYDGTNVTVGYSMNGGDAFYLLSAPVATYFTTAPDKVGFCMEKNNAVATNDFATVWGFELH